VHAGFPRDKSDQRMSDCASRVRLVGNSLQVETQTQEKVRLERNVILRKVRLGRKIRLGRKVKLKKSDLDESQTMEVRLRRILGFGRKVILCSVYYTIALPSHFIVIIAPRTPLLNHFPPIRQSYAPPFQCDTHLPV
jgi:hypothetical protein